MAIADLLFVVSDRVRGNPKQSLLCLIYVVPVAYLFINEVIRRNARIRNLKGPSWLPLIGNIWDIRVNAAERYRQWAHKFGPVYQIPLGNIPILFVNSAAAAKAMFGKYGQALSSRPEFYTFHQVNIFLAPPFLSGKSVKLTELPGRLQYRGTTIGTSPYSDSLKRRRKGAASALNRPSVATYVPHLDVESRDFIRVIYTYGKGGETPIDPMPMIQRLSLSLSLTLNWGIRLKSREDNLFDEIT